MELLHALVVAVIAAVVLFVATHLRSLDPEEVTQLARKRRFSDIRKHFHFYFGQVGVNNEFKRQMEASGKFYRVNQTLFEFPSRVAGLLKYKKHEWVVVALEKDKNVDLIWINKGFDRDSASIHLPAEKIADIAGQGNYDSILIFHNYPNPKPNRYDCARPSPRDLNTAQNYAHILNANGLNLVKFICERGRPYKYYLSPANNFFPLTHFESAIHQVNGRSVMKNLRLHVERIFRSQFNLHH